MDVPIPFSPVLEKAFGAWKAEGMAPLVAEVPMAPQLKSRQIYIVDKPEAAQSQIRIGWVGVPRSTPGRSWTSSATPTPPSNSTRRRSVRPK
jgi:predicted Zn-dependent peptidase